MRRVDVADLLGRAETHLDEASLRNAFTGKTVMITGGAGTIGSELARRVIEFDPAKLILLDRAHVLSNASHATRAINCAYSITHTFNRAASAGAVTTKTANDYQTRIDAYRTQWRESQETANLRLVETLSQYLVDAQNLATQVASFAESERHYLAPADALHSSFRFNNGTLRFHETSENTPNDAEITIPAIWIAHLVAQSQMKGIIPAEIATRIHSSDASSEVNISPNMLNLLARRMELSNNIASMLTPLGMRDNVYRFGHLLPPNK